MGSVRSSVFILSLALCGVLWTSKPVSCLPLQTDHNITTSLPGFPPGNIPTTITVLPGSAPGNDQNITTSLPISASKDETDYSDNSVSGLVLNTQDVMQKVRNKEECTVLNTTENMFGLQTVKEFNEKSLTFFIRPKSSFKKLVFRIKLGTVLKFFDTEEAIDIHNSDLVHSISEPWTSIDVKYYMKSSIGLKYHALNVTVGNTTLSLVSHYNWFIYNYKGFVISAEGGAHVLFNCLPIDLQELTQQASSYNGVWLMAGLFITAAILLVALFFVWLSLRCRKRSHKAQAPLSSLVYEEFDEEVLEKIRQKVETLRSGKSQSDLRYTGVVSYEASRENPYVMSTTLLQDSEKQKEVSEEEERHVYQNVFAGRPIPAPRFIKETPRVEPQYHNMLSISSICREADDECPSVDESPGESEGIYQNPTSILICRAEEVDMRHTEKVTTDAAREER